MARSTDDVPVGEPRPTASQLHTRTPGAVAADMAG